MPIWEGFQKSGMDGKNIQKIQEIQKVQQIQEILEISEIVDLGRLFEKEAGAGGFEKTRQGRAQRSNITDFGRIPKRRGKGRCR